MNRYSQIKGKIKFSFWIMLFIFSCSKADTQEKDCTITFVNIVGNWSWNKIEILENGIFKDYTSTIESCQKDDYFTFLSNKRYFRVDAGQKCSTPIIETGFWDYSNNLFYLDFQIAEVLNYDCTLLTIKTTRSGITYRITYKRI